MGLCVGRGRALEIGILCKYVCTATMAHLINVLAWNVRGLGDASKRCAVFMYLKQFYPAILCLSETHLIADKLNLLRKPWFSHTYHSVYSSHSRGVSILVHSQIPFQCHRSVIDSDGRYVCLVCSVHNTMLILVAVYIPPPYSGEVLRKILTFLDASPRAPVIIIGDFNMYLHPYWDKFHSGSIAPDSRPTSLARVLVEIGFQDLWRTRFPTAKQYSCYSSSHQSLSRIDLAVGSALLLPLVSAVEYLPRSVSDHSPLRVQLRLGPDVLLPKRCWRLNPFWVQLIDIVLLKELQEYFQLNESTSSPAVVWDTMKAVVRGLYIREISRRKSKSRELTLAHQQQVVDTESRFVLNPSPAAKAAWEEAQKLLRDHMLSRADNKRFFTQQKYFIEGESSGHLLATVVKAQQGSSHIASLMGNNGAVVTEAADILETLQNYYERLYSSRCEGGEEDLIHYLAQIHMPVLSTESKQLLDRPLTLEELERALQLAPNDKAPGSDGLPAEFYKVYKDTLLPQLLLVFQEAVDSGQLPASMREAIVVLLPKPGKDPLYPDSYRPISLLPVDVKLLAKVLANRLSSVITEVVHGDQTGFMPNQSTAVNLRRLFLNLQLGLGTDGGRAVLSLDAAKAFDSVEWNYLWAVLHKLGFGPSFISWIKLLYSAPVAKIRTGSLLSLPFALHRGTRQGCPLSPLLFALAVEPLACKIRTSPDITGFQIKGMEERISLYADDILLYLGDVVASINPIMEIIGEFGSWSGLLINWDKSVLMPLDQPSLPLLSVSVPLQVVSEFRYLGIVIRPKPQDYIDTNLSPLMAKISTKIDAWCRLPLSVIGRSNLVKMIVMPQLLYILHNAPIWIPACYFHKIHRMFRELIWRKKVARIRLETLQRSKCAGGLAIPNAWLYFIASQMQHFAGWGRGGCLGVVGRIFSQWSGRQVPCHDLETGGTQINKRRYPTLALMYKVWDRGKTILALTGLSKYTPLWDNPVLPELQKLVGFDNWTHLGISVLPQVQRDGSFKSFEGLRADFPLPHASFYQFLQLRHAYNAQAQLTDLTIQPHCTLDFLLMATNTKGLISELYRCLLEEHLKAYPLQICNKWSAEVGPLSDDQWTSILELTPQLSPCEAQRLSQLYLVHRVYRSPALLCRIGARTDSMCPRCGRADAHIMHMVWECAALGAFWRAVMDLIRSTYNIRLPAEPKICILGLLETPEADTPIFLAISRMLFQARKLIAYHWLRPSPPTLREYVDRMNHIIRLERGVYLKRKASHKYEAIWGPWLDAPGLPTQVLLQDRIRWMA